MGNLFRKFKLFSSLIFLGIFSFNFCFVNFFEESTITFAAEESIQESISGEVQIPSSFSIIDSSKPFPAGMSSGEIVKEFQNFKENSFLGAETEKIREDSNGLFVQMEVFAPEEVVLEITENLYYLENLEKSGDLNDNDNLNNEENEDYLYDYFTTKIEKNFLLGAYLGTIKAFEEKNYFEKSLIWIREYKNSTRISQVNSDLGNAFDQYSKAEIELPELIEIYKTDILSTYQFKFNESLEKISEYSERGFEGLLAKEIASAEVYWGFLSGKYQEEFGEEKNLEIEELLNSLIDLSFLENGDISRDISEIKNLVNEFVAAPLSETEKQEKAGQLGSFLKLVPIEYDRGVKNGEVFIDIEIQEAVTFFDGAQNAYQDLRSEIKENLEKGGSLDNSENLTLDDLNLETLDNLFSETEEIIRNAQEKTKVEEPKIVKENVSKITEILEYSLPEEWLESDGADFEIIFQILVQMEEEIKNGNWEAAELKRLEAYGIFDLGAEIKLLALNPRLVAEIDGQFWYGYKDKEGLINKISSISENGSQTSKIPSETELNEIREIIKNLKLSLQEAEKALGENQSPIVVIVNSAIIVFREGLEALLVIFALIGSMKYKSSTAPYRKPIIIGVIIALIACVITWIIADRIIENFLVFGEKLEAIISLIAIAVLLLITNWFFHNVYWNRWNQEFAKNKHKLLHKDSSSKAKFVGFLLLGLASVYREGFETVLFLQVLVLDAGIITVLQGFALGTLGLLVAGYVTFKLQKTLPYLKMFIVTGVLIVLILFMMVGQTVQTMQAVGWMEITPIEWLNLPYWMGQWFGVYATWQGIFWQILTMTVVGGSYLFVELRKRKKFKKTA